MIDPARPFSNFRYIQTKKLLLGLETMITLIWTYKQDFQA